MPTELALDRDPVENGTLIVTAKFRNHRKESMTPNSGLSWSLYRKDGTVVNNRDGESITPDSEVSIVLSGADLPRGNLILLVDGTYNSEIDGTPYQDLPVRDECEFQVQPLMR